MIEFLVGRGIPHRFPNFFKVTLKAFFIKLFSNMLGELQAMIFCLFVFLFGFN